MEDRTFKCIHCGNPVRGGSTQCPHCGREVTDPEIWYVKYARNIVGAVFGGIVAVPVSWFVVGVAVRMIGSSNPPANTAMLDVSAGNWFCRLIPVSGLVGAIVGFFAWDKLAAWMGSGGARGQGPRRYWRV